MVLLNLLIAVMSETWSNIKEHEEVEWKLLSVSSIDEFFQLHHVPPPFNCVQLLRHLHRHFADGSDLPHHATSSPPLLSREDIKKRAKTAQLKVLDKQRQEDEQLPQHMLEQLGRQQREMADRLEKLAGAADRTSSELRQLTVERRARRKTNTPPQAPHATSMSSKTWELRHASSAATRRRPASSCMPPASHLSRRVALSEWPCPGHRLILSSRRSPTRAATPRAAPPSRAATPKVQGPPEGGDSKSSIAILLPPP